MMSSFWALSFVPIKDTIQAFETLAIHCGDEEQAVLDYFESNYIGEESCGEDGDYSQCSHTNSGI